MRSSLLALFTLGLCASVSQHRDAALFHAIENPQAALAFYNRSEQHIPYSLLDESSLRALASNNAPLALLQLAQRLVSAKDYRGAQVYWQKALDYDVASMLPFWHTLCGLLKEHQQWQALAVIRQSVKLPEDAELMWRINEGLPVDSVRDNTSIELGFGTALAHAQAGTCPYNVLLLGDSLAAMEQLQRIKSQYEAQPEPQSGLICLSQPNYIGGHIECALNDAQFSLCDWRRIAAKPVDFPQGFDFIIMMTQSGLANVRAGIMHMSVQSKYHTFLHELLHFSGFTDEYPAPMKQQRYCEQQGHLFANLYVGDSAPKGWAQSDYCTNGRGYKPTSAVSIMEHSEVGLSQPYRELWVEQLENSQKQLRFADWFFAISGNEKWRQYRLALENKNNA